MCGAPAMKRYQRHLAMKDPLLPPWCARPKSKSVHAEESVPLQQLAAQVREQQPQQQGYSSQELAVHMECRLRARAQERRHYMQHRGACKSRTKAGHSKRGPGNFQYTGARHNGGKAQWRQATRKKPTKSMAGDRPVQAQCRVTQCGVDGRPFLGAVPGGAVRRLAGRAAIGRATAHLSLRRSRGRACARGTTAARAAAAAAAAPHPTPATRRRRCRQPGCSALNPPWCPSCF